MLEVTVKHPMEIARTIGVIRNGKLYRKDVANKHIRHSVAYYKISERLGFGVVPSYEVIGDLTAETWVVGRERLGLEDIMEPSGAKIAILDFITSGGVIDRFSWMNSKIDRHRSVWALDNNRAFLSIQDNGLDWEVSDRSVFVHLWVQCESFGDGHLGTTSYHDVIEQIIREIGQKLNQDLLEDLGLTADEECWAAYRIKLLHKHLGERHTLARALFDWRRFVNNGILRRAWFPSFVTSEQTIPYLAYTLTPSSTVIDIGGAEGEEAKFFNSTYGCRVFTMDPRPEAASLLREKFQGNPKIHIVEAAVARHDGTAIMGNTGHSASITLNGDPLERPISSGPQVPTIRLKTLLDKLQSLGIAKVDLIRMNCEGGEMLVLRSIDEELAGKIDQLSFVIHTQMFPLETYYEAIKPLEKWYTVLVDKDTPYDRHFLLVNRRIWERLADK